ncbi:MAG: hypothetical protein ABTQ31_17280 [Rhizobiaceae bacterium]
MGNGVGNYAEDRHTTMRVYDAMPPQLREAHRNAIFYIASGPSLKTCREAGAHEAIEQIIRTDMNAARKTAKKHWGKQAEDYLAVQRPRRRRDWLDKPPRSKL